MDYKKESEAIRLRTGGQLEIKLKASLDTQEQLAVFYSPGIAGPCESIARDYALSKKLTIRKNTVAVISNGSAVLGLGDIGAAASLPVMEGKCMLLKHFAGVDAIPIVLDTPDKEAIIQTITHLAPTFGGINLEDIKAPDCFEIEKRLSEILDIPVFHDDQHGTAICVLAGLINALKIVNKEVSQVKIIISGAGAAAIATAKLLRLFGFKFITLVDSKGIVSKDRTDINQDKRDFAVETGGGLEEGVSGSDIFLGLSRKDVLTPQMVETMNDEPIVFAMANPNPEIDPEIARNTKIAIMATGRSDYPNQINNVLVFPGMFRGLLDHQINRVTDQMKLAAASALASLVKNPNPEYIIPSPFDPEIVPCVSKSIVL